LFQGIDDSMVIAYLQGYMGEAYADRLPNPRLAVIISGEYCFFGGPADSEDAKQTAENIFDYIEGDSSVAIYASDNLGWRDLLLSIGKNNPVEVARYGIVQKDYDFDREKLKAIMDSIPEAFECKPFDEKIYDEAMSQAWSREFCETFTSAKDYLEKGFGFGVIYNGQLVAGASTMTVYDGGVEVQIATKDEFQRKGLAMVCAAALLLECMNRKIRPCWDAATLVSKHMALKLGYEYRGEYSTVHMHK
jgi:hypothetical protein